MVEFELFAPDGNAGAVKRYRLFEQLLAPILVTVMTAGAEGTANLILANFTAVYLLVHPLNDLTFRLSVVNAASLELYLTNNVLELLMSPESTVTPETPPTDVGKIQLYIVPTGATDAVYL
jgi:predicted membrane-bound spermidine synthase